jgi:hypothetical protein
MKISSQVLSNITAAGHVKSEGAELHWDRCSLSTSALLPIIPPTAPHSSSCGAGTVGQIVADVPGGLSLIPTQEKIYYGNSLRE